MFNDQKLLKRLLATFRGEARDHLQTIASGLLQLERQPAAALGDGILDEAFRAAHSLKGAARTVNVGGIETACQSMESVFSALKRGELTVTPLLLDDLHRSLNSLEGALLALDRAGEPPRGDKPGDGDSVSPAHPPERTHASDTVRVDIEKLEAILAQAEELVSLKLATGRLARDLSQLRLRSGEWQRRWARLQDDARQLQQNPTPARLERVGEFLEWSRDLSHSLHEAIGELSNVSEREHRHAGAMIDTLLDDAKAASMLPFSSLVLGFPRLARELSRELGKEVDLEITGGDVEVDRRVLDEMKDPVTHLLRNCIDHGIEPVARRAAAGKPAKGKITIQLKSIAGNQAELIISDDGGGIDIEKLHAAASRLGLQPVTDPLALIFSPGVSTSPMVTDISGRGLGMAIVKERVEKLGGEVSVESEPGQGTAFRMVLPLSLSRFRGLLVKTRGRRFVLPVGQIDHVLRVPRNTIKTVQNRETINHEGTPFVLLSLSQVLDLRGASVDSPPALLHVVIAGSGSQRLAFHVDEILHEQEVLVKPLGRQLVRLRNIAGAAILEDAAVVPVLHVGDLMKSAARSGPLAAATVPKAEVKIRHAILVAEDSITSRTLLKGILETAGYRVETAVDGVDAFTKLRAGQFDLIVSDVDMPRLNGFGLTARIRADSKLAELPVVLVTALDSRADREHGVDVGANAYIVKSSFDQGNLLEAIRRLV
jgi:two-component system, chemotaxis family, sensor kinase CheA